MHCQLPLLNSGPEVYRERVYALPSPMCGMKGLGLSLCSVVCVLQQRLLDLSRLTLTLD